MRYELKRKHESLGWACVERQGLYYAIECRCSLPEQGRYRVMAVGDRGQVDLGLLVPMGKEYGLKTRVSMKTVGENLNFRIIETEHVGRFIPVQEDRPFAGLSELRHGVFMKKGGQWGILISQMSNSKPTGQ